MRFLVAREGDRKETFMLCGENHATDNADSPKRALSATTIVQLIMIGPCEVNEGEGLHLQAISAPCLRTTKKETAEASSFGLKSGITGR
jgi:hypothetical protein